MKKLIMKRCAAMLLAIGVVFGCSTGTDPEELASTVREETGSQDNRFSDDPTSPGGTGGVADLEVNAPAEATQSFFTAFQIDPVAEDTAGPKFVVAGDVDQDGMLDLVSAWNESQPIQLHLQRRDAGDNISFYTITIAGTSPTAVMAGVELGQINDDGWLDIVVLVKATGSATFCPTSPPSELGLLDGKIVVYFNPGAANLVVDGDRWDEVLIDNPMLLTLGTSHTHYPGSAEVDFEVAKTHPELAGYTALAVGEINGLPGDDIVVALNTAECDELGQKPPINTIDLYINPGPGLSEMPDQWGVPVTIEANLPQANDIVLLDVDEDGDQDLVYTYTNSVTRNIEWARNPFIPHEVGGPSGSVAVEAGMSDGYRFHATNWQKRPVATLDTGADVLDIGDVDGDGSVDVVVRSTNGGLIQWFRHPNVFDVEPVFPPPDESPDRLNFPWQVYTLVEYSDGQIPEGIALGDLTGNGKLELVAAAMGSVVWYGFDSTIAEDVKEPWNANTIIQDTPVNMTDPNAPIGGGTTAPGVPGVQGGGAGVTAVDTSTVVNSLLVVDLDGDGRNDIIGTLDRRSGSGLSDDRLVWYRNTRTEE